ncbi:hypothetical protein ACQ4PT_001622 [Festuca glaucescens]
MAQAQSCSVCETYALTNTGNQGRVLDAAEPVPPRDADELATERLAHGGCRDAVGDQPVERSDAAAIRAAEERAIGPGAAIPAGVAEQAEAAASSNATAAHGEGKVTIGDDLRWNATAKLPTDKAMTREDAAGAPGEATKPYGVGAALTEAARHRTTRRNHGK